MAGGPEASKNSKKSAKVNEKKIQEKLSKTRYFSTVNRSFPFLLLIKKCGFEKNSYVFSYAKVVIRKQGFYRV